MRTDKDPIPSTTREPLEATRLPPPDDARPTGRCVPHRRDLLQQIPLQLGATWAATVCDGVRREGRTVAGGWPGTLPEARGRISQQVNAELARHGFVALTETELAEATNSAYARAKQEWLEVARCSKLEARRGG